MQNTYLLGMQGQLQHTEMENKITSLRFTSSETTTGINGSVIEDAIDGALEATAMEDGCGSIDHIMVLTSQETLPVIVQEEVDVVLDSDGE